MLGALLHTNTSADVHTCSVTFLYLSKGHHREQGHFSDTILVWDAPREGNQETAHPYHKHIPRPWKKSVNKTTPAKLCHTSKSTGHSVSHRVQVPPELL